MDYIELLNELVQDVKKLEYRDNIEKDRIEGKLNLYIQKCFGEESKYISYIKNINFYSWDFDNEQSQIEAWRIGKEKFINLINIMIEDINLSKLTEQTITNIKEKGEVMYDKVFIIHGHDDALKQEVARFIEKLGLEAVILHEQANKGRTIIEKFENFSDVGFAVALLTPDDKIVKDNDEGKVSSYYRARQNVIFEMGFFIGALGRERVFSLVKGDKIEIPSDYSSVVYSKYEEGSWKLDLIKELKAVGYNFDANKAF